MLAQAQCLQVCIAALEQGAHHALGRGMQQCCGGDRLSKAINRGVFARLFGGERAIVRACVEGADSYGGDHVLGNLGGSTADAAHRDEGKYPPPTRQDG